MTEHWIARFAIDQLVTDDAGRVLLFASEAEALAEGRRQWSDAEEYVDAREAVRHELRDGFRLRDDGMNGSTHRAESVTLHWGEIPAWMERVGTRGTITRNGIPFTRFGKWIGEEPVFVLRHVTEPDVRLEES